MPLKITVCSISSFSFAAMGYGLRLAFGSHPLIYPWYSLCLISFLNHTLNPSVTAIVYIDKALAHTIPTYHAILHPNIFTYSALCYAATVYYTKTKFLPKSSLSYWHASVHVVSSALALIGTHLWWGGSKYPSRL